MSAVEAAVFGAVDYTVFVIMLFISLTIGIYFGFYGTKLNSAHNYLSGVQDINLTSIAISLVASAISASALLTIPSEVYSYGIMVFLLNPMTAIVFLLIAYVYIPIYYKTGVSNAYEYLERRFDWKVHKLVATFFVVYSYTYTPIVQYMPCLAFSQVTGLNVHVINAMIGTICIIYTMIGGIKAVIWTDVVQALIMCASGVAIIVYGVINVGGMDVVFKRSEEGGRLNIFDFDPDLTKRNSFWIMLCSCFATTLGQTAFNQTLVQRLIALKSEVHARRVMLIFFIGLMIISTLNFFTGLVIYATFYKCDPIKAKIIAKGDRILPYFVMNTVGHWTGMPGLFIAAMFSAAFSTISAQMNSLAGIMYNEYFRKWRLFKHTDFRANLFMKLIILTTGIYFILAGFIIDNSDHVIQIVFTIFGATIGVTTGVFTLGMLTPWANKHGAFYGALISAGITVWMVIGNLMSFKNGSLSYSSLPTSVEDCEFVKYNISTPVNSTLNPAFSNTMPEVPFILYRLSFYSFGMVSVVLVWVFGLIISFMTGYVKSGELDKNLLATCMHWLLPKPTAFDNEINGKQIDQKSRLEEDMNLRFDLNKLH